jgi:hypothetical protein
MVMAFFVCVNEINIILFHAALLKKLLERQEVITLNGSGFLYLRINITG